MKTASLLPALAFLLAACATPTPSCPTGQTLCTGTCFDTQSDSLNCGGCGAVCGAQQTCQAGKCSSSICLVPDVYATCWVGGGLVGICSETGAQTPTAIVAPPPGDGGTGNPIVPQLYGGVFTGADTLWLVDNENNQIDVVDTVRWPPPPVVAISAAAGDSTYSVTQVVSCDGMVLALRTATPLLEAYDSASFAFVNELSLASDAGSQFPAAVACDGNHTAYVTDSLNNTVTSVDLDTFKITAQTSLPAADQLPPLPGDGGAISPSLSAVAFAVAANAKVLVSLQNLDSNYVAVAPSTTFELDPALTTWSSPIDPGAQCLDAFQMVVSPDQSTSYLACGGVFNTANATSVKPYNPTGYVGVVSVAGTAAAPLATTLSNPTSVAFLKNGLLAIGDYTSQSEVAFYNPADGGISYVNVNCPLLSDGGLNPQQGVTGVIAAP